jgi:hypothetical protein
MGFLDRLKGSSQKFTENGRKEIYYNFYLELYTKIMDEKELLYQLAKAYQHQNSSECFKIESEIVRRTNDVTVKKILLKYNISKIELDNIFKEGFEKRWPRISKGQMALEKGFPPEVALALERPLY